ncbi:putative chromatin regulator PHD family [Medicago truncatula]|uniref:Putative chromatin regulator PHD family n=1 Tax=Medicago truncatula TaxID=3880 RepID=A0A396JDJ5_MEDTR|nr:protein FORGETTER 1 isoform X3 [Medicago truncatula]RHN74383.1 putative chromatin regulator PHD family [Medicago truncatula]
MNRQPQPPPPSTARARCAGCRAYFSAAQGVAELPCPNCQMPHVFFVDSSAVKIRCSSCKAVVNAPSNLSKFPCPQCHVRIDVHADVEEVNELVNEVEQEEGDGGIAGETFTDYRPSKLSIGSPHPDPIVETSSLSAVQPPEPTYDPKIKNDLERSKALSCLQIETLVYACQRHLQHVPSGPRAGFFIGDGAGVGKGRTVAGLIWENWHHGRRKTLWISVGSDLKFDARRDLDDMGASCIPVHALNKLPYTKLDTKSVGVREGVIFSTYSSLIASSDRGRTRMQQLVQWCGPKFDGLIIFDECHKAKNLVPEKDKKPTKTGQAVLDIQAQLPEARVVYCSATGASEPRNMAYMVRLGLWGAGTFFPDFGEFLGALNNGGVGALELVAMDLKARGMYLSRTLSYKGAEFEIIDAPLDDRMMHAYKKATEVWMDLRKKLQSVIELISDKINTRQLWRSYWASHQRFFRHMCMSSKVPTAVKLVNQALMEDKCVVIGLQSTGEARTEEAVSKYGSEFDDFISGPRELLLKFVEDNFPLPQKPELLPDDGVKELQRKRHLASPDVSGKSRVRKVAKRQPPSDSESDEESETASVPESSDSDYGPEGNESAASGLESSDSDYEEFQKCEICSTEEERDNLLQCSHCGKYAHHSCLVPPISDFVLEEWACDLCKDTTVNYLPPGTDIIELQKRYDTAMECKKNILEMICALDLPNNPLDDIIDQLGGHDKVAEITGRKGMLVRAPSGTGVFYQTRNTKDVTAEMVNMNEKKLFMEGKKLVAIISEAGSAGVSLQADRRVINQKRRVHLTLELPWSADRAIQQFGRTHRSNQVSAPEYRLLFSNLGGERRFASAVAKRLESLGALTQGDRRAGPSLSAYNYDSAYGKRALMLLYNGILERDPLPVVPPGCLSDRPDTIKDFIMQAKAALLSVGIFKDDGLGDDDMNCYIDDKNDIHNIGRFLNRLLGIAPETQNRLFELFVNILDLLVNKARIEGNLDTGIVDLKANVIELQGTPKTVYVDQMSRASTVLFTFTLDRGVSWELANTMLNEKQKVGFCSTGDGFYKSKREWLGKRHVILAFESSAPSMYKIVRPPTGESTRDMHLLELTRKYSKVSSLKEAQIGWETEYEASFKQCMHGPNCKIGKFCSVGSRIQQVNVLGGVILPVWGNIDKALSKQARHMHKRLRIVRVETTSDNRHIVGLLVPNAAVETVLQGLSYVIELDD